MCFNDEMRCYLDLIFIYYDDIYYIMLGSINDHHTALDLTQTVMAKAWEKFNTLKEPEKSKAWVKKIARNELRDYMRRKKVYLRRCDRVFLSQVTKLELSIIESDIANALARKEDRDRVMDALDLLPERFSEIIRLHLIGEQKLKDIAKSKRMKAGTVRAYYSDGMRRFRSIYKKLEEGGSYNVKKKKK